VAASTGVVMALRQHAHVAVICGLVLDLDAIAAPRPDRPKTSAHDFNG